MNTQKDNNGYYQLPLLDGLELLDANFCKLNFPNHSHSTFNITLVLENTFLTKIDNKIIKAPTGSIFITNPNEIHATPCDNYRGNTFCTFYVSPELIEYLNFGNTIFFNDKVIHNPRIFNELLSLTKNFSKNSFDAESFKKCLGYLISNYSKAKKIEQNTSFLFQDFIDSDSFENFSLDKTSFQFGMNKYKFLRLFKQETGLTPNNFILLKRIEQSKKLLREGHSIFEVAIDSGFYDASHYYKHFKRFIGVNPLDYQKAFLKL